MSLPVGNVEGTKKPTTAKCRNGSVGPEFRMRNTNQLVLIVALF